MVSASDGREATDFLRAAPYLIGRPKLRILHTPEDLREEPVKLVSFFKAPHFTQIAGASGTSCGTSCNGTGFSER